MSLEPGHSSEVRLGMPCADTGNGESNHMMEETKEHTREVKGPPLDSSSFSSPSHGHQGHPHLQQYSHVAMTKTKLNKKTHILKCLEMDPPLSSPVCLQTVRSPLSSCLPDNPKIPATTIASFLTSCSTLIPKYTFV